MAKRKLPRYTFKQALAKIAPCSEHYNKAWWKKQFGRKRFITARDILKVPAKEFRWGMADETLMGRKSYAAYRLCFVSAALYAMWYRWKRDHLEGTPEEIKFALELFDRYERGEVV